jgi:hypothetical protein
VDKILPFVRSDVLTASVLAARVSWPCWSRLSPDHAQAITFDCLKPVWDRDMPRDVYALFQEMHECGRCQMRPKLQMRFSRGPETISDLWPLKIVCVVHWDNPWNRGFSWRHEIDIVYAQIEEKIKMFHVNMGIMHSFLSDEAKIILKWLPYEFSCFCFEKCPKRMMQSRSRRKTESYVSKHGYRYVCIKTQIYKVNETYLNPSMIDKQ